MTSRRDFIRISGLGLGGLAVSASGYGVYNALNDNPPDPDGLKMDLTRTPTYCEVCFWKCAGWVYKNEEGKIWKVIGNDDDQHSKNKPKYDFLLHDLLLFLIFPAKVVDL